jgi:hypothetical protein
MEGNPEGSKLSQVAGMALAMSSAMRSQLALFRRLLLAPRSFLVLLLIGCLL